MPHMKIEVELDVNKLLKDASSAIQKYSEVDLDANTELTDILRQIRTIKGHLDFVIASPEKDHLDNDYLMATLEELMRKYQLGTINAVIRKEFNGLPQPRTMNQATNNVVVRVLGKHLDNLLRKYKVDRISRTYTKQEISTLRHKFHEAMPWLYRKINSSQT